jgi:Domain of unknown function (DUF4430)
VKLSRLGRAVHLSERAQAVLFAVGLTLAIGGLYAYIEATQTPLPVTYRVVASLVIEGPTWTIRYTNATVDNATAFGILVSASHAMHFVVTNVTYAFPPGVFVTSINGTANGQGGNWLYWIDGSFGTVASDRAPLRSGDLVLWQFSSSGG